MAAAGRSLADDGAADCRGKASTGGAALAAIFKTARRSPQAVTPPALVVIGAHRGELAFGEGVVEGLDAGRYQVLRIPKGISGRRPTPEERPAYLRRHRQLYAQILEYLAPAHRVLIDLHTGLDTAGCAADVLCARREVLRCIDDLQSGAESPLPAPVRLVRLLDGHGQGEAPESCDPRWAVARPELPEEVWNRAQPTYVGLEVYLSAEGAGTEVERALGRALLEAIAGCVLTSAP
jgi:hypothetical protein